MKVIFPRGANEWRAFQHGSRGIAAWAVGVSSILHLLVALLVPVGTPDGIDRQAAFVETSTAAWGRQGIVVAPWKAPAPNQDGSEITPAILTSRPTETVDAAPALRPSPEAIEDADLESPPGAGERHNPLIWRGFSDMRLAAGLPILDPEKALAEVLARPEAYASPLRQCYDSIDARAARARDAQNWSLTTRRGWRWGISADGIHLGPITVPVAPAPPPPGEVNWRPERDPCVDR